MKAFKFMKIDMRRTKAQIWCMLLFGLMAYGFSYSAGNIFSGIFYLMFAAVIMQGAVFTYEQKPETGFTNMLPGTNLDRAAGRFLLGGFLLLVGNILGMIVAIALYFQGKIALSYLPEILISLFGFGLLFLAIQNIVFYMIGKGNSQQLMSLIHMIPGMALWIGTSILITFLETEGEEVEKIVKVLLWGKENSLLLSLGILILGVVFTILGVFITEKILNRKDFA